MRFQKLSIENYGVHSQRTIEFPELGATVLFGANEAGKSTLLQLFRDAIFDIPPKTPYRFSSGEMSVEIDALLQDGSRVLCRKRKGRKDVFKGEIISDTGSSRPLTKEQFEDRLGNISRPLYESLFGFSLAELHQGQESLKRASFEQAVLGSAVGGTLVLEKLQNDLKKSTVDLFLPNGGRILNKLLTQLKTCERDLDASIVKPAGYRELFEHAEKLERELANIENQLDEGNAKLNELSRHSGAYPHIQRRFSLIEQLKSKNVPSNFNQAIGNHWRHLVTERQRLVNSQRTSLKELETLRAELSSFLVVEAYVTLHGAISAVAQRAAGITATRSEYSDISRQIAAINASISDSVASLPIPESVASELLHRTPASDFLRHRTTFAEYKNYEQLYADLARSIEDDRHRLERLQNDSFREIPIADLHRVSAIVERLRDAMPRYRDLRRETEEHREEVDRLNTDLARLAEAAGIKPDEVLSIDSIPAGKLENWSRSWQEHRQAISDAKRKVDEYQSEVEETEQALREQSQELDIPDSTQIIESRERRDVVLRSLTEILESTTEPIPLLWQQALVQALRLRSELKLQDQFHDKLVTHAKAVAERESKVKQLEAKRKRHGTAATRYEKEQHRLSELELQWKSDHPPVGTVSLSPESRLAWQTEVESARARHLLFQSTATEYKKTETEVRDLFDSLRNVGDIIKGLDWDTALVTLNHQHAEWLKSQGKQAQRTQQLSELEEKIAKTSRALAELSSKCESGKVAFEECLHRVGVSTSLTVDQALESFDRLSEAAAKRGEARTLELRVEQLKADLETFGNEIAAIGRELPQDEQLESLPAEPRIAEWKRRAGLSNQNFQTRQKRLGEVASLERTIARDTDELKRVDSEITNLMNSLQAQDADQVELWCSLWSDRLNLQNQLHTAEAQIDIYRGPEDLDLFIAKVQRVSEDGRKREIELLESQITSDKEKYQSILIELDRARQSITALNHNIAIEQLQIDRMGLLATIAENAEQWAVLQIEHFILAKAAEEYRRKHTPQTLLLANRFIRDMTNGRYVEISADDDLENTLCVKRAGGSHLSPEQLSTGTREQLYLALRLAYVEQYCHEHEPLPLIMDDCLVNFDEVRAEACLRAICAMPDQIQKIFLTCHERTVRLLEKIAPETHIIQLSS